MRLECTGCQSVFEIGEDLIGQSVRCSKCSAVITVSAPAAPPADTFANPEVAARVRPTTPARDARDEDDAYPLRRPRPQVASSGSGMIVLILLLAVGLPLVVMIGFVGLGVAFWFLQHNEVRMAEEIRVAEAQPMAVMEMPAEIAFGEDRVKIAVDVPGIVDPNDPVGILELAPFAEPARLKEFTNENLGPNNQPGPLAPTAKIWELIAAADQKRIEPSPLVKGNWGNVNFRETGPDNGILIGFFASSSNNWLVDYVQPIYLTAKGEKTGKSYGSPNNRVVCVKAKQGYAVGALDVRSGDLFDGFTVTFMRVNGERLDVNDAYRSQRIGGNGGDALRVGGDGAVLVGIHGRSLAQANLTPAGSITSLGVLSLR